MSLVLLKEPSVERSTFQRISARVDDVFQTLFARARELAVPGRFFVEDTEEGVTGHSYLFCYLATRLLGGAYLLAGRLDEGEAPRGEDKRGLDGVRS